MWGLGERASSSGCCPMCMGSVEPMGIMTPLEGTRLGAAKGESFLQPILSLRVFFASDCHAGPWKQFGLLLGDPGLANAFCVCGDNRR